MINKEKFTGDNKEGGEFFSCFYMNIVSNLKISQKEIYKVAKNIHGEPLFLVWINVRTIQLLVLLNLRKIQGQDLVFQY